MSLGVAEVLKVLGEKQALTPKETQKEVFSAGILKDRKLARDFAEIVGLFFSAFASVKIWPVLPTPFR